MQNNKKRNNRNKKPQAAKKVDEDDGDWEELLNAPLPNDESTADMTHCSEVAKPKEESKNGKASVDEEWEDADDDTQATNDSNTARAGQRDAGEAVEDGVQGKKKRKKRANKRTVAKLKEMRRDFMDRCVSPNYVRVSRLQLNGEIALRNLKGLGVNGPEPNSAPYMNTRSKNVKKEPPVMVPNMPLLG